MPAIPPPVDRGFIEGLSGAEGCLLVTDVLDFATFNYRFGFGRGDVLLATLYENLRRLDREVTVHRFGSDQFVLVLPQTSCKNPQDFVGRVLAVVPRAFSRALEVADEDVLWWIEEDRARGRADHNPPRAVTIGMAVGLLLPELLDEALSDVWRQRRACGGRG